MDCGWRQVSRAGHREAGLRSGDLMSRVKAEWKLTLRRSRELVPSFHKASQGSSGPKAHRVTGTWNQPQLSDLGLVDKCLHLSACLFRQARALLS